MIEKPQNLPLLVVCDYLPWGSITLTSLPNRAILSLVLDEGFRKSPDGKSAGRRYVLGLVDNSHAAVTDLVDDPELPGDQTPFRQGASGRFKRLG